MVGFQSDAAVALTHATDAADDGPADAGHFAVIEGRPVTGRALVVDGVTLAPPAGTSFGVWLPVDLDGDGQSTDVAATATGGDHLARTAMVFRRDEAGLTRVAMADVLPTDARCAEATLRLTSPRSMVVGWRCPTTAADAGAPVGLVMEEALVALGTAPAVRERAGLRAPQPTDGEITLALEGTDRDGDGVDEVVVNVLAGARRASVRAVYFARPGGLARDASEPAASFAALIERARRGVSARRRSTLATALGSFDDVARLRRAACQGSDGLRLDLHGAGIPCEGVSWSARRRARRGRPGGRGVPGGVGADAGGDGLGVGLGERAEGARGASSCDDARAWSGGAPRAVDRERAVARPDERAAVGAVVRHAGEPDGDQRAGRGERDDRSGGADVHAGRRRDGGGSCGALARWEHGDRGLRRDVPWPRRGALPGERRRVRGAVDASVWGCGARERGDGGAGVGGERRAGGALRGGRRGDGVARGDAASIAVRVDAVGRDAGGGRPRGDGDRERGGVGRRVAGVAIARPEGVWVRDRSGWKLLAPPELAGRYGDLTDLAATSDGRAVAALLGAEVWVIERARAAGH